MMLKMAHLFQTVQRVVLAGYPFLAYWVWRVTRFIQEEINANLYKKEECRFDLLSSKI